MKRAVAYIRVSREDENPQNQWFAIQEWAKKHGYQVVPFFDVAVSGTVDPFKRPGFTAMLSYMKNEGIRTIIVAELERLTRDVEHYEKLRDLKQILGWAMEEDIQIISIADQKLMEIVDSIRETIRELRNTFKNAKYLKPVYEMVAQIMILVVEKLPELKISIAEAERERVVERTKRALERLRSEGLIYTKPTLIHWLALFRSGKTEFKELTPEEIREAENYFYQRYVSLYRQGYPVQRIWRIFQENEAPLLDFIRKRREVELEARARAGRRLPKRPNYYTSYPTFYKLITRLAAKKREA